MKDISILDCTLRDGAYLIDKKFGEASIRGIVNGLISTGFNVLRSASFRMTDLGQGRRYIRILLMREKMFLGINTVGFLQCWPITADMI